MPDRRFASSAASVSTLIRRQQRAIPAAEYPAQCSRAFSFSTFVYVSRASRIRSSSSSLSRNVISFPPASSHARTMPQCVACPGRIESGVYRCLLTAGIISGNTACTAGRHFFRIEVRNVAAEASGGGIGFGCCLARLSMPVMCPREYLPSCSRTSCGIQVGGRNDLRVLVADLKFAPMVVNDKLAKGEMRLHNGQSFRCTSWSRARTLLPSIRRFSSWGQLNRAANLQAASEHSPLS